jgi:hypothetical protein
VTLSGHTFAQILLDYDQPTAGPCPPMKHPAEWTPEEIEAHQDRLRKLEASSQKLCDLLQGCKLTVEERLKIVEQITQNLTELERLERINEELIARLCGTFVASRWIT